MNSKRVGNITESVIISEFVKLGIPVLVPFGDNERYDLVVEINGKFIKVQCKTGTVKGNCINFCTSSSMVHRGLGRRSYVGQIDLFAVYCIGLNKSFIIGVDKTPTRAMSLRIADTKNSQKLKINYASDFEFNKIIGKMLSDVKS